MSTRRRQTRTRVRGEGTIYFHKASGRYAAQLVVGVKPDGKPDRRTVYGKTPEEVAEKLHELRQQAKEGTLPKPNRVTVKEWSEQWLDEFSSLKKHRENTREFYENAVRWITDKYGTKLLKDLTGQDLTDLYVEMSDKVGLRQMEIVHNAAGLMLRAAVKKKLIPYDVTQDVAYTPRVAYDDEPRALEPEEFQALLDQAAVMKGTKGKWVAGFRLALNAAMHRAELLGVQVGDIDLRRWRVHVQHQVLRVKGGALMLSPLKTHARRRTVPLGPATVAAIKEWMNVLREETGLDILPANVFLFPWYHRGRFKLDEPTSPEALNAAFRKCAQRAGIADATFHTIRATTATWLAELRTPLKTTMRIMGLARPETLTKYYTRVTERSLEDAVKRLDTVAGSLAPYASDEETAVEGLEKLLQ